MSIMRWREDKFTQCQHLHTCSRCWTAPHTNSQDFSLMCTSGPPGWEAAAARVLARGAALGRERVPPGGQREATSSGRRICCPCIWNPPSCWHKGSSPCSECVPRIRQIHVNHVPKVLLAVRVPTRQSSTLISWISMHVKHYYEPWGP